MDWQREEVSRRLYDSDDGCRCQLVKTRGGTMREKAVEVRMRTERRGGDRGDTHSCIDPEDGGKQGFSNAGEKVAPQPSQACLCTLKFILSPSYGHNSSSCEFSMSFCSISSGAPCCVSGRPLSCRQGSLTPPPPSPLRQPPREGWWTPRRIGLNDSMERLERGGFSTVQGQVEVLPFLLTAFQESRGHSLFGYRPLCVS